MKPWPEVQLDTVARLRVLAAGLPHVAWAERVIPATFADVWSLVGDLEHGAPSYETGLRRVEISARDGDRLELEARGALGVRQALTAELRPGWCLMQSGGFVIGIAASAESETSTRVAHFEGIPGWGRWLRPLIGWKVRRELQTMEHQLVPAPPKER